MPSAVPITNDLQLMQVLGNDFKLVIDDLAEWILGQIQQSIETNVYSYPEGDYERLYYNGGFIGAWEKEATKFAGNYIESKVDMNPLSMVLNAENHQHGNAAGEDRRADMASLIETGTGYDFGGNAMVKRDFWSPIEQMIVSSGEIDTVFENIMTKHGIKFIKTF